MDAIERLNDPSIRRGARDFLNREASVALMAGDIKVVVLKLARAGGSRRRVSSLHRSGPAASGSGDWQRMGCHSGRAMIG